MIKKIIVTGTVLFLMFEVLYFQSNIALDSVGDSHENQIYKLTLKEEKEEFFKNYQGIILEDMDESVVVLTNEKVIHEIEEKYHISVEK